jgi:ATP-dependent helicase HrpB
MLALPVDDVLTEILAHHAAGRNVVVQALPGAGKTTRVPPAIARTLKQGERLIMLEPRRVAARASAARIASEQGWTLGDEVGFHIRHERRASAKTRLLVVTEGLLVRMLLDDPFLEGVNTLIFDEFHERNLSSDLALALARQLQREARPDLRIIVMSATLDTRAVSDFLGDAPVVFTEGRLFPVTIKHLGRPEERKLEHAVEAAAVQALRETSGDLLVFLPGVEEIRRAGDRLSVVAASQALDLVPLYGDLPGAEQDRALRAGPRRRIVLATNVAETSITVEGVTAVVDAGLARVMRLDTATGLDRLELGRISLASAKQRAGRSGRTGPGTCYRLWSEHDERAMREFEEPEIRRVDPAGAALSLLSWGEPDPRRFGWYEPPDAAALAQSLELLERLGATNSAGLTTTGGIMAGLPTAPRIARMLIEAQRSGRGRVGARLAALLSDRDPLRSREGARHASESDIVDRLEWLERERSRGGGRQLLAAAEQLDRAVSGRVKVDAVAAGVGDEEALGRAVLAGWPDRVARRREPNQARAAMTGGRGVVLAPSSSVLHSELFVCVSLDAGRREARAESQVYLAHGIERKWLPQDQLRTERSCEYDSATGGVRGFERAYYRDLVLSERAAPAGAEAAAAALAEAFAANPDAFLAAAEGGHDRLLQRVAFLRETMPELDWPSWNGLFFADAAEELCIGARHRDALGDGRVTHLLMRSLSPQQRSALDREAPDKLRVPSGAEHAVDYANPAAPFLAVRIQELFGWPETPTVASGRVPLVLHLLAPNYRPQQVTRDLRNFWNVTYLEVRKQMRVRYPKHDWPVDPWNAVASRGAKRRPPPT